MFGAGFFQSFGACACRRTCGEHIVHQQDSAAFNTLWLRYHEHATHVFTPLRIGQPDLGWPVFFPP